MSTAQIYELACDWFREACEAFRANDILLHREASAMHALTRRRSLPWR